MSRSFLASAVVGSLLSGCSAAPKPGSSEELAERQSTFEKVDANHDGHISWDEFRVGVTAILEKENSWRAAGFRTMFPGQQQSILRSNFDKMDTGHKGYLVFSEWKDE
ncbi:EF-hand domain-containing protein [Acetobacter estunensis]|nr:EF-hand domain-containing protein [Acetobacter estunensis]MBV1838300.1 EF-hand domain-containing protein [Acetobacter estunensis]